MKAVQQFILFNFLILYTLIATAQEFKISPNSNYFAIQAGEYTEKDTLLVEKNEKTKQKLVDLNVKEINIFQLRSLAWIRSFKLKSLKKIKIEEMGFSFGGKVFYVKDKNQTAIWNVQHGNLIFNQEGENTLGFSNFSNFFIIHKDNKLLAYDSETGEFIREYRFSKSKEVTQIDVINDDQHFVVKTSDGSLFIYHADTAKAVKRVKGTEFRFIKDSKRFVTLRKKEDKYYNYIYSFPDFNKINSFWGYSDFESLSTDGKYIAIYMKRGRIIEKKKSSFDMLVIKDSETGYQWARLVDTDTLKLRLTNFTWLKNNTIAFDQQYSASLFNIASDRMVMDLDYTFSFTDSKTTIGRQLQNIEVSDSRQYVALQDFQNKKPILYLKSSAIPDANAICSNAQFLSFTPNSKYVIAKKDGKLGFVRAAEIEAIKDNMAEIKFYAFSDELKDPVPEKEIDEDALAPENYVYHRMQNFKHISSVPESELVNLYLKTIEVTDTLTGLQVHLMDKNGTYYYGASEYKWMHIWKNLLLQDEKGRIQEVTKFRVFEYSERDNLPTALAIVMDHSGSMGQKRAFTSQEGAKMLIEKKAKKDALTIIKYDSNIGVEVPLSPTEERLRKDFKVEGLGKYGGSTSLLDAVDKAVSVLKNAEGYKRKAVIIFTDGNENSSLISKGQMLKSAAANDVSVFTIGFGDYVSEDYLKALAFYTQGSYYRIFNTTDFNWVFEDVYRKIRNYYSIRFETDTIGVYSALLQIEIDENRKDELATTFDNTPFDFDLLDENDFDYDFKAPIREIKSSDLELKDLVEYKDSVQLVKNEMTLKKEAEIKKQKEETLKKQKEDFSKINFPKIQFLYSEVKIIEGSEKGIDEVVAFMKKYPDVSIEIAGHTDNVGNSDENILLSLARAKAVKMLLEKEGIKSKRIEIQGFGDKFPLNSNKTEEGREKNRRVEFKIIE